LDGAPRDVFRHSRDKLAHAGVDVPGVCTLLAELAGRGLAVEDIALTTEEATATILEAVRRRGRC